MTGPAMPSSSMSCDIAIVGGGLAGGLAVLAIRAQRPDLNVLLVEPGRIGGSHVWSWFDTDIAPEHRAMMAPLIAHHWDSYDIAFPARRRTLATGYNSTSGERLDAAVRAALPAARIIEAAAVDMAPTYMLLDDQRRVTARHVIDARGMGNCDVLQCGWQKFVGQRLTVAGGHGVERPVVMDATVDQIDGFRFVYLLPFDATSLFVEDTYYADTPALDKAALRARIADYAAARGWQVTAADAEESGVLPVVMGGRFDDYWPTRDAVARLGVRAGAFQATTGYSLPDAVRMAAMIADHADAPNLPARLRRFAQRTWRRQRFYRMLDTMLFHAAEPAERYRVLQRFYGLSPRLIERFYAGQSTRADMLRVVTGKPPVPFWRGVGVIKDLNWL